MRLTLFTDYALRTLIFAALKDRPVSLDEISSSFDMSRNHLIKVVTHLEKNGFLQTKRGVGGGIFLAKDPKEINIKDVVLSTENDFDIVECFNKEKNTCPIASCCSLKNIISKANSAFLQELAGYNLHDITGNADELSKFI